MGMFTKQKTISRVLLLNIREISSNPYQPRSQFEPRALQELADSISQNGLLQPVTVREWENGYQLIAGERRLMACKMLGMEQIPAIVNRVDDEKSAVFALIENLQRKDLNYFEEAQGIQTLMQTSGMSQQEVAKKLGKAQSTVANKLRLLFFGEDLRQKMLDNGLTERHARALLRLPNERLVNEAIQYIVAERLNVGESESYIESLLTAVPEKPPSKPATRLFVVKDLRIFMNTITKAVSTMRLAGIEVDTSKEEDEEYIHYLVKIPKKSAYRSSHSA
ncbi:MULTISPECIES: ParB/RepB/Spo0J family partition protein [unclassified Anaerotruncus]|jgi:ParB family chromosome partitioning protein|uniref:ParB/RepB/Spo0J family partition protein n=1 Tax=unclassified Anaerotruncus TaxID=2641626 RepID=UPI00033B1740|nr:MULTISPECIES: ParB/RepB/Spo0J family partition protein [unclassified Anaerotruncus]MCI9160887.1 ParB/RepB/Spo0J family partition protein [Anaerotruncus sp.]NCE74812.1 ParB/RepB/Spo0J family partition protein [Anaerotruncus sp. X29]RKJ88837.1 ParB/RepB/Spo0J family partition protein [Anaerotruncus sp. 1XD22-93]EOS55941.1 ParB-like partition protein [Anaerotruncus sp. G3(2012)]MCI9235667.1 ParB/RepB/Spo0J family partition protein [Anaerotruncus sp.]